MKRISALLLFFLLRAYCGAQNADAYLIPREVYVGDMAELVLPLPDKAPPTTAAKTLSTIILTQADPGFPVDNDIDFHRVIMERGASGSRLLVEFTAFKPGKLEFPAIEIDGMKFTGLKAEISSIIGADSGALELSGPASTLAAPGTGFLVYGTLAAGVIVVILLLFFAVRGRSLLGKLRYNFKMWRLFSSAKNIEKRLYKSLLRGDNVRGILDKLSDEFKVFLSYYTGSGCTAMTANELELLPVADGQEIKAGFLGNFFHKCDMYRFSGIPASVKDAAGLLKDMRQFIAALEKKEAS